MASGLVVASPRGRMLEAIGQAVATKGYAATTVADVVSRAGVSRKTFYVGGTLHDTIARTLESALNTLRAHRDAGPLLPANADGLPAGAIAFIIETRVATPAVREHHRQILERFAELTRHPDATPFDDDPEADRLFRLAGVIAVEDTADYEIAQGRTERLIELEDTLVKLAARLTGVADPESADVHRVDTAWTPKPSKVGRVDPLSHLLRQLGQHPLHHPAHQGLEQPHRAFGLHAHL
jgi:hypothetical protein